MQLIKFCLLSTFFSSIGLFCNAQQKVLVCYGKFDVNQVSGYDLIVLESAHFNASQISILKKNNKKIVAYISLAEISELSSNYKLLKNKTLGKNNNWNSYYLDLSSSVTINVLNASFLKIINKGCDGFFLDNIDNFGSFGLQKGFKKYAIKLIADTKAKYPKSIIIQNAGLELLNETNTFIDLVAIESFATHYSFETGLYGLRESKDFLQYKEKIQLFDKKYKKPIVLIEYADSKSLSIKIKERLKSIGYSYFIGDINLQEIPSF